MAYIPAPAYETAPCTSQHACPSDGCFTFKLLVTDLTDISACNEAEHVLGIHLVVVSSVLAWFADSRTRYVNQREQNQSDCRNGDERKPAPPTSAETAWQMISVIHRELVPSQRGAVHAAMTGRCATVQIGARFSVDDREEWACRR